MDMLLILTYTAICIRTFKLSECPSTNGRCRPPHSVVPFCWAAFTVL